MKNKQELWITNVNRFQDITLGDLALKVPRGRSINLLAKKKNGLSLYNLTQKQIDKSFKDGSLFHKSLYIKIRDVVPEVFVTHVEVAPILDMSVTRNVRKPPEIEKIDFPDLDMDDNSTADEEAFAAATADMDVADRTPVLAIDPIFKRYADDE